MGGPGLEPASGVGKRSAGVTPEKSLGRQAGPKDRQFSLKCVGRSSPKSYAYGVVALDSSLKRQTSTQTEAGHESKTSKYSGKRKEHVSLKSKRQQVSRELSSGTGRIINEQSSENSKGKDGAQLHELFKKEFIEKLAEKAKQRSAYLVPIEDFVEPVVVKDEPKVFRETQSLDRENTFTGTLKGDPLERTVRTIEPRRTIQRTYSLQKKGSSAVHEKFNDTSWMSKCKKLNRNHHKKSWSSSKVVEETSKDILLSKYFQTPTQVTAPAYSDDIYAAESNEEMSPRSYSSTQHILSSKHSASQKIKNVQQQVLIDDEVQNLGHIIADSKRSRGHRRLDTTGNRLADHSAQIRRDTFNTSSTSAGGRFLSVESGKDFLNTSTRSSRPPSAVKDLRCRDHKPNGSTSLNEGQNKKAIKSELPGMHSNVTLTTGDHEEYDCESQLVVTEKENMLRSLTMATAVDQAHFLRALQDNGAVQSYTPMRMDFEEPAYCDGIDSLQRKPPFPNGTRNSNILREARGNTFYGMDARGYFLGEAGEARNWEKTLSESEHNSLETSLKLFGSTNLVHTVSGRRRRSIDGSSDRNGLLGGEIQRNNSGDGLALQGGNLLQGENLLQFTSAGSSPLYDIPGNQSLRQSSHRSSIPSDENESGSGVSIIQMLMKKASLRSSLSSPGNQTSVALEDSSTVPVSPPYSRPLASWSPSSDSKAGLRRNLSFADSSTDLTKQSLESERRGTASLPFSNENLVGRSSSKPRLAEDLTVSGSSGESKSWTTRVHPVLEQSKVPTSAAAASAGRHLLNNSLRVNTKCTCCGRASTATEPGSLIVRSPIIPDHQDSNGEAVTVVEPCRPIATPQRTLSAVSSAGTPWSPGSDDSGSDVSGIEQPSPVSVLLYNNDRTPFREDSPLSPLEQKLQELHERIHKSKRDVRNQKKANLAKIKARELELRLCVVTETPGLLVVKAAHDLVPLGPSNLKEKSSTIVTSVTDTKDEKVDKVPRLDLCRALETFELQSIASWTEEQKWDLVYVRDVLVASNFGLDKSMMTRWHSVTQPMDPRLFEALEDFYKNGQEFSSSQSLSRLAVSQEDHLRMQEYIQSVHFGPVNTHRDNIDAMNRWHLFDVVNETLAQKLVPYVALPRPWMKPLAKPVVRPRPTGSGLLQEVWAEICDQIGNTGSLAMDKAQLQQSLDDLSSADLYRRSDLFPFRKVERAAELIVLELERWIFEDLLEETIISLRNSV